MSYGGGVIFGADKFVAVAFGGTPDRVMTSHNGIHWLPQTCPLNNWVSVAYGEPHGIPTFVATAIAVTTGQVMTSHDGMTWDTRTAASVNYWYGVTYGEPSGNPLFVAVAASGTGNRVMTSHDGFNWTSQLSAADVAWTSVTYGNGLFVAVAITNSNNGVMTSPDGFNWSIQTTPVNNEWRSVTYGSPSGIGPLFVAVATTGNNDRVMTSSDGTNWVTQTTHVNNRWTSVTYGNGLFVAVAEDGINRVMTSPNGATWTIRSTPTDNNWKCVAYSNTLALFAAVSSTGSEDRVMTGVDNSCYLKGTKILTSTGYKLIEDLRIGDLIKTYKNENKKIIHVGKKLFSNSTTNILFSMYKSKETGLIVAGGHYILVDELTEEQKNQLYQSHTRKIEDKHLLLCCYSDLFEKLEPNNEVFEIYHLCLENEDLNGQYGIWADNMLSESCSINHFREKKFE